MKAATQAPVNREAIQAALAPFGQSRTLPGEAYTSEAVFAWEMEHFFERRWICAGRAEDIAEAGQQRAVRAGQENILLVRDEGGRARAFYNVCRHRGHELVAPESARQAEVIRCQYHVWTYRLDGSLKHAPRVGEQPGFEATEHGLIACEAEEWRGWVFVTAAGEAGALAQQIGDLEGRVRGHEPERLVRVAAHSYEVAANWKLIQENYHECYHCPSIHPQLCRVTPPESGLNFAGAGAWAGGSMDLLPHAQTMSFTGESRGVFLRGLSARQRRLVYYYGLFPNLLISLHPDYVLTHRLEPLAPRRTRIECEWLFPPEALEQPGFDPAYAVEFWDTTNLQDWSACESVQRGVASRGYRPGPLSEREGAVHRFLSMVARGYLGEPQAEGAGGAPAEK